MQDYIRNARARTTHHRSDHALLLEFIQQNKDSILFHQVEENASGDIDFTLVLSTPALLEARHKYGARVVGLDSVWKWTKHHIPIWLVVVDTESHGGLVVGVIVSTSGSSDTIALGLDYILGTDSPKVMIDHDAAERKAVDTLGVLSFTILSHYLASFFAL